MTQHLGIRLVDVGADYGRHRAVDGITTSPFAAGDVVALLGPNGAGKSTLLKRIAGLLTGPGRIELVGAGREEIGYLPQDHAAPAGLTAYEAVLLAAKRNGAWSVSTAELAQVDATMTMLGLTGLAARGLDTLSGGQRQLVSIAQSLVRQPRIILMDEPTSALDLHHQLEVLSLLRDLAETRGVIVLVSLHDVNLALRFASHAMVLADGRLRACGRSLDVICEQMMRAVFAVEARIELCSRGQPHVMIDGIKKR